MVGEKETHPLSERSLIGLDKKNRAAKRTKRELYHALANGFVHTLKPWAHVVEEPLGNPNYFCIKIDGITR